MKQYKMKKLGDGRICILFLCNGLFGPQWESLGVFAAECQEQAKRIVSLLNECDNITKSNL